MAAAAIAAAAVKEEGDKVIAMSAIFISFAAAAVTIILDGITVENL